MSGKSGLTRNFTKLWAALSISLMGSSISTLALPLIAVVTIHASALEMGILAFAGQFPFLLCSLPLGVLVDRMRRRPLLIAADIASALLLATVPAVVPLGGPSFAQLCAVAFGVGTCQVVWAIAHYSYVPTLVGRENLTASNSRIQISYSAADAAGPGVAGAVIQLLTAPFAVLADAASFLVSAFLMRSITTPEERPVTAGPPERLRRSLAAGARHVMGHRLLRPILLTGVVAVLFQNGVLAIYVLYATRRLGLSPLGIGLTFAAGGVGALPGAVLARWAGDRFGVGPAMIGGWVIGAVAGLLIPFAGGPELLVIATLAISKGLAALTSTVSNIHQWSLRQIVTPNHLAGRVTATQRFIIYGVGSVGSLLGGALSTVVGLRATIFICSGGVLLAPLWTLFSPLRHLREHPAPAEEAPAGKPAEEAA